MPSTLTWTAVLFAAFIFWRLVVRNKEPEDLEPEPMVYQKFTPKSLAPYNGVDNPRVLLGVKNKVYDVTSAKSYYGPGGMYENFAGRDASRGLAKHSFEPEHLTPLDQPIDELLDLTSDERAQLDQWSDFFAGKYPHCGDLVDKL